MNVRKFSVRAAIAILPVILLAHFSSASYAAEKCGVVEKLEGAVYAVRSGREVELGVGSEVLAADVIRAKETGYAEIRFVDDTLMAIGGGSEMAIDEIQFSAQRKSFKASINRGAVWFATGSVGLANPAGVKFRTPRALVSSGNASIQFSVTGGTDSVSVHWLPKGGKVRVYNVRTKESVDLTTPDVTLNIGPTGAMEQGVIQPEDENEYIAPETLSPPE
ncbi:MAG: FecR family protein [Synergistaceae bacterium]|jgi:hypothetical protein|nr:FecR family protein [Synergistaceae bacterium]